MLMIVYKYPITAHVFVMALGQFDLLAVHTSLLLWFELWTRHWPLITLLVQIQPLKLHYPFTYNGFQIPIICWKQYWYCNNSRRKTLPRWVLLPTTTKQDIMWPHTCQPPLCILSSPTSIWIIVTNSGTLLNIHVIPLKVCTTLKQR